MRIINFIADSWVVRLVSESQAMKWAERHAGLLLDVWLAVIAVAFIAFGIMAMIGITI